MKTTLPPLALSGALLLLPLAACQDSGDELPGSGETPPAASAPAPEPTPEMDAADTGGSLLDPDMAGRAELVALPGIDEATADALVAGRPYASMVDVDAVLTAQGLDEAQRDSVYARLWRPIDLNGATDDEILLVPGVGPRMLREFKEYRPYTAMAQFEREIGKYVDDAQVARWERYVTVGDQGGS